MSSDEQPLPRHRSGALDRYKPDTSDRITLDESPDLPDDSIDEIVLSGVDVHLERMSDYQYNLNVTVGPAGSSLLGQFWIARKGRKVIVTMSNLEGTEVERIPQVETPEVGA